jgi:hypothetical protein
MAKMRAKNAMKETYDIAAAGNYENFHKQSEACRW